LSKFSISVIPSDKKAKVCSRM